MWCNENEYCRVLQEENYNDKYNAHCLDRNDLPCVLEGNLFNLWLFESEEVNIHPSNVTQILQLARRHEAVMRAAIKLDDVIFATAPRGGSGGGGMKSEL